MVRIAPALLAIVAVAQDASDEGKMAAVNKVVTMLSDLHAQVMKEGEDEAAAYNKFGCFCKDTTADKNEAITKGEDEQTEKTTNIETLNEKRDGLDTQIEELEVAIEEANEEMKKATSERKETQTTYEKNEADVSGAIKALEGAITVIKSSKPSLMQLNSVSETVKRAALMADAMGFASSAKSEKVLSMFLQQDPVPMEDYKFKSDNVIDMLEQLHKNFRAEKNALDEEDTQSKSEYDMFMQEKSDHVKAKTQELDDSKKEKSITSEQIASNSEELSTISADLLDDKDYLSQLAEICVAKAKTWDQRSQVRADELTALTAAVEIIKDTVAEKTSSATVRLAQQGAQIYVAHAVAKDERAMEAVEAAAEEADAATSFLQKRQITEHSSTPPDVRNAVMSMLKAAAGKYKSTLLMDVANHMKKDPFVKIKKLIQDLIERLLHESAEEANQKGWCDKAQGDARQKRTYAAESIAELNSEVAGLEATRNKLVEELGVVGQEIQDLEAKMDEATEMREDEQAQNAVTITESQAGLDATNMAIDILDKFYKTAGKAEVDLSLAQKGPLDDMPDTGFDAGEAYTGAGGESGGILGMLDVIKSDFERTVSQTEIAEREAKEEYQDFMTQSGKSLAEKKMAHEQKLKQKDDALEKLESANTDLDSKSAILNLAIKELLDLKPTCIDTGMSYEDRVSRREDEMESLKKALCIFESFAEYGPEGAGGAC